MAPIVTSYPELTAPLHGIKSHGHIPRLEHENMYEPERPGWQTQAACLGFIMQGKDWWFPLGSARGIDQIRAKQICDTCPVSTECLADAMQQGPYCVGIWGGTTANDRKRLRVKGINPGPVPVEKHGTQYRYYKYKCRCDPCRLAHNENQRQLRLRRKPAA